MLLKLPAVSCPRESWVDVNNNNNNSNNINNNNNNNNISKSYHRSMIWRSILWARESSVKTWKNTSPWSERSRCHPASEAISQHVKSTSPWSERSRCHPASEAISQHVHGRTNSHTQYPLDTPRNIKSKVLPKPHGPMEWHWSPFPIALSQTPAYSARPRIQG